MKYEKQIQSFVDGFLRQEGIFNIRIDDGLYRLLNRIPGGAKYHAARSIRGLPDNTCCLPIHGTPFFLGLAIENKSDIGKLHGTQNQVARNMNTQVVREPEELIKLYGQYQKAIDKITEILTEEINDGT